MGTATAPYVRVPKNVIAQREEFLPTMATLSPLLIPADLSII